jgi:hypothetical protein
MRIPGNMRHDPTKGWQGAAASTAATSSVGTEGRFDDERRSRAILPSVPHEHVAIVVCDPVDYEAIGVVRSRRTRTASCQCPVGR